MAGDLREKSCRVRIPPNDLVTQQWLEHQNNRSLSIRWLIAKAVDEHGMKDAFEAYPMSDITATSKKKEG